MMYLSAFISQAIHNYRLNLALLLSVLIHGTIIFNISRSNTRLLPPVKTPLPMLEVNLVAQPPDFPTQNKTIAKEETISSVPAKINTPAKIQETISTRIEASKILGQQLLLHAAHYQQQDKKPIPIAKTTPKLNSPSPQPSARELIAGLDQQLIREIQGHSHQPRKQYIDSHTKRYAAVAYLNAWCKKIERIGKMSYPEKAKQQELSGSLVLAVDLNPDGTVADIIVRRSSGYKVLDKAAIHIVRLAAPFAKVPETVLQGYDMLSIVRTWQFHSNTDFSSS
ncbi:TonB family protein [Candidatus Nitrosoglobus terrae]|uniref:TonB family protein n=1 Tax=Candidatus Nitrosoglobus terrae TaxID=1630141 RepID=A0A1Q2SK55_9GAMM|nr:energy transducer TonB [Candidatus Nitrosoglobus terrae]BAW79516.1 TonB family protein [Candidatus Nitrosoglobus terrae]